MTTEVPQTRYVKTADGVHIAYQVAGDGPMDLLVTSSNLGLGRIWHEGAVFPHRYVGIGRLILLDRRGTGLSDRILAHEQQLTLDAQMDDVRAVLDAVGSPRAVLLGFESGFAAAAVFAASFPERVAGLIAFGAQARTGWAPDYPWGTPRTAHEAELVEIEEGWGTPQLARLWIEALDPGGTTEPRAVQDFVEWMQSIGGPGDAVRWAEMDFGLDLRHVLPSIRVPTLILHRAHDPAVSIEHGRFLAAHIPGAELRELPGTTHMWSRGDDVPGEVERFVGALHREEVEFDRYLATVVFSDIVGSTEVVVDRGDAAWRTLVEEHHRIVRGALARFRGVEMDTAGDGFFATFDGPVRAVRSAQTIVEGVRALGIEVRVGIHTGELQMIDDKAGGIAVTIGARVMAAAGPSEVLVSQTVKDLTAGSGLVFDEAGEHELKGVPDRWRLYRVVE